MTRDEVKKLLMIICATYPNFHPDDMRFTIDAWYAHLSGDDYEVVALALKAYDRDNTTGFAPSIGQLLNKARSLIKTELTELEAWALVSKAIGRSAYYSVEEFNKLPPAVRRAVGSADNLRVWATDNDANFTVVQSQFQRSYRGAIEQERQEELMSADIKAMLANKMAERIGVEKAKALEDNGYV